MDVANITTSYSVKLLPDNTWCLYQDYPGRGSLCWEHNWSMWWLRIGPRGQRIGPTISMEVLQKMFPLQLEFYTWFINATQEECDLKSMMYVLGA